MVNIKSKEIPWILTVIAGGAMYAAYYFNVPMIDTFASSLTTTTIIITTIAMGLGTINLVRTHLRYISSKREAKEQKLLSGYWIFICLATFLLGIIPPMLTNSGYNFLQEQIRIPARLAGKALFMPWVLLAAYRTFRIRNLESFFFSISAVIVALGNVPIGSIFWSGFPILGMWITNTVITAVFRAITIGIGLGYVTLAIRNYLRLEKSVWGESDTQE